MKYGTYGLQSDTEEDKKQFHPGPLLPVPHPQHTECKRKQQSGGRDNTCFSSGFSQITVTLSIQSCQGPRAEYQRKHASQKGVNRYTDPLRKQSSISFLSLEFNKSHLKWEEPHWWVTVQFGEMVSLETPKPHVQQSLTCGSFTVSQVPLSSP